MTRRPDGPGAGDHSAARLVALAVLAFLLFNVPLLAVFDRPVRVLGVPLVWAYLLGAWLLVIGLLAAIARDR